MKVLVLIALFHSGCLAWIAQPNRLRISHDANAPSTCQFMSEGKSDDGAVSEDESGNPCWQNLYDDDCSMSTIYSASFVANDWIKSMPCAAGIEDCDMPEDLKLPLAHGDPGIDQVDVMSFLQLKRTTLLKKNAGADEKKASP